MFYWRSIPLEPDSEPGTDIALPFADVPTFATREEAEAWLGEYFTDLEDEDIAEVYLYDGDQLVFGPMGLNEA